MNVTRRQIRAALTRYETQVHQTGHATTTETWLYDALKAVLTDSVIIGQTEQRILKRAEYAELMVNELLEAFDEDTETSFSVFQADEISRDDEGIVTVVLGTRTTFSASLSSPNAWIPTGQHPHILGDIG